MWGRTVRVRTHSSVHAAQFHRAAPAAATKVLHKHQPCFVDFLRTPPFVHFFWAKSF
jgi:hypothetical protein